MKFRILVVEDQKDISDILTKYIRKEGFDVSVAKDGFEALELFRNEMIHLVLLDVMMPGIDGFEVLKSIRSSSDVPVIMLTAREGESDRIYGFDSGADDYVVKPFSPREVMKRIHVMLRRVYGESDEMIYEYSDMKLYAQSMKLFRGDEEITLTSAEFKLLETLFRHQGQVLSREQLIMLAYGDDYEGYDRNIDSYIKRIRRKIEDDPKKPKLLVTKYGAGYQFGGAK